MPRFIPPHLIVLGSIVIFLVWITLVHRFRQSPSMQKFVAEALGDDTPGNTLRTFELSRQRLIDYLDDPNLDADTRRRIEVALALPAEGRPTDVLASNVPLEESISD